MWLAAWILLCVSSVVVWCLHMSEGCLDPHLTVALGQYLLST